MPLMKISEYRVKTFTEESRPSINTIKKWVDNGVICGKNYDGMRPLHEPLLLVPD